jgi:hypothetical protein
MHLPNSRGEALFVGLSKIGHVALPKWAHSRIMASESKMLTSEEFASLLTVGNTSAVVDRPAAIPAEHSAKLIALGYMVDLDGRLRMTTPGRQRIRAGFENTSLPTAPKSSAAGAP